MCSELSVNKNPLGTEKIGKLILSFAVPSILSMVVNALYNIVDQVFIGHGVGYLGNGATNVIMPLTVIVIALSLLVGDGAAAYLSLKLGQNDAKSAAYGVGNAIIAAFIIGIVLCVLFNIFLEPMCIMFGVTEDILPYAMDYGRIISYGVLFSAIDSAMAGIIRADGSPKYSMAGLLVGCITNIILDPIFIFVFRWGVKGAGLATILGQIFNAILYFTYIWKFKSIKLDKKCFLLKIKILTKVVSLGISSFIAQIAIVLVMAVTNNVLVSYGEKSVYGADIPLTTIGITMKVNQIITAVIMGLATGSQPIFGYNYGSGQKNRVKQTYKIILFFSTIILTLTFFIFQFAPMSIIRIFGSESDLYNKFAVKCFKIFLLACPINGLHMVTGIFFQAIGKPTQATILSLTRQIVFLIPATLLIPMAIGVEGVLWAGPFADVLAFLTTLVMLKIYWKKI